MPNPETPTSNTLFYNALIQGLQRGEPQVRFSDAHYLHGTLPPTDIFPGGSFMVNNYLNVLLLDGPSIPDQGAYENLMRAGKAFLTAEVELGDKPNQGCMVARPQDLHPDNIILDAAVRAGLEPVPEEPFAYDGVNNLYIPDPFQEPHLLALYRYLEG